MPITLVRFLLRYLPTPKLDVLYERSLKPFRDYLVPISKALLKAFWDYMVRTQHAKNIIDTNILDTFTLFIEILM